MIINAPTILITLFLVTVGCYIGLKFIRAFALQIARENHDAIAAMDQAEEELRLKRERAADAAAASAFAKVKPILTTTTTTPSAASASISKDTPTGKILSGDSGLIVSSGSGDGEVQPQTVAATASV